MQSIKRAFAPANISCIFRIFEHADPRWMGSYGIGFTLNEGVIVSASEAKHSEILFNGKKIIFPTVESTIKKLTDRKIWIGIESKLPLGCGFGLSGASALASAFAVNELLGLKKEGKELAVLAHTAEVENRTGLGDVVNQFYGGFLAKFSPSSHFSITRLPVIDEPVYCKWFSSIETKSIIGNRELDERINGSAALSIDKIKSLLDTAEKREEKIKLGHIIKISKEFAVESGLLKDKGVLETIEEVEFNGGNASMIMLGNSVFSDRYFEGAMKTRILKKGCYNL